jgi:hypothetical protein
VGRHTLNNVVDAIGPLKLSYNSKRETNLNWPLTYGTKMVGNKDREDGSGLKVKGFILFLFFLLITLMDFIINLGNVHEK